MPQTFCAVLGLAVAILGASFDVRSARIPNQLTIGGLAAGASARVYFGWLEAGVAGAWYGLAFAFVGAIACALVPVLCFRMGAMGGGDVKLLAALGAICGPLVGIQTQFYALSLLATFCTARLAYHGELLGFLRGAILILLSPFAKRRKPAAIAPALLSVRAAPAILAGLIVSIALQPVH